MGNCCFRIVNPWPPNNLFEQSSESSRRDWLILDEEDGITTTTTAIAASPFTSQVAESRKLTIILTLQESSNINLSARWIQRNASCIRNVLIGSLPSQLLSADLPQHNATRTRTTQPDWSSGEVAHLFRIISRLQNLEKLLLYDVGTVSNPLPVQHLCRIFCRTSPHAHLRQAYLVGNFEGDLVDCQLLATGLRRQPSLTKFALCGNGSHHFSIDPILRAVTALTTLKELHFHANMPLAIQTSTILAVGTMRHLTSLTVYSCDTNGANLALLCQQLEGLTSLKAFTIFEALQGLQPQSTEKSIVGTSLSDKAAPIPGNCLPLLYSLVRNSPSLDKIQVWFGFSQSSRVLQPLADALRDNTKITSFETALLWTDYDDETAQAFVEMLRQGYGSRLKRLQLHNYRGKWQWPLAFFVRLNETGRYDIQQREEFMTRNEWMQTCLINIPPGLDEVTMASVSANNSTGLSEDWFSVSWIYYYLRRNPSFC